MPNEEADRRIYRLSFSKKAEERYYSFAGEVIKKTCFKFILFCLLPASDIGHRTTHTQQLL